MPTPPVPHDTFAALRYRDFSIVTINQFCLTLAILMQEVIVAYALYHLTRDPLVLGFIGLAEAIPFIALSLWGGYFADRYNRQIIMQICMVLSLPLPLILSALFSSHENGDLTAQQLSMGVYGIIFLLGTIRGFYNPSVSSLKPFLVPRNLYPNAATWTTIGWQSAVVLGPVTGGLLLGYLGLHQTLYLVTGLLLVCSVLLTLLKRRRFPPIEHDSVLLSLSEGFRFIFKTKIIFWSISLDLVSVLFGGVIALLPIYADDILKVGAEGLGLLRAAPSVGALLMMVVLAKYPPTHHAWRNMLLAVAGFGVFTLVFAFSTTLWLSLLALALTGAFDSISVVIRQTILQIFPPENLRGRVAAVNGMFVSSSNELGAFESGVAARYLTVIPATILGGSITLLVAALTYFKTRDLLNVDVEHSKPVEVKE
ncbi:MFS transporter [Alkanindiges hydrocarboniclasticus]|uniref:MFS transporter n=1 Tax=Alkanindiges hydrocarboniclasticus TaxID=1907941 RepID=A0A1S8CZS6_9GAMM|nr:MFS transporter [Alkanindiges hydrocarboniclasticus]ONG41983.1 MFS transporter [Alkanindiges hydrocarboniclasticus]